MEGLLQFLDVVRKHGKVAGHFRGLMHVLIGRRITSPEGVVLSTGQTWREAAALLKRARWDKAVVAELGVDPDDLPPRDRERYWYAAILHAQLNSIATQRDGDVVAAKVTALGYQVGPSPGT